MNPLLSPKLRLAFVGVFSTIIPACGSDAGSDPSTHEQSATGGSASDVEAGTGGSTGGTILATGGVVDLGTGGLPPTGGTGTGGEPTVELPETTTLEGVTYEVIECGVPLPANAQLVFGPEIDTYGGWSHANNPEHAASYTALRSEDRSVYDYTDPAKTAEEECGGALTLRRTLLRKIHEHTQKHSNGLQVRGSFPEISTVSALVIDLKLEAEGSHLPVVAAIHDGLATVRIETDGTSESPRYRIDPKYADHWIRITIPAENFGNGTPAKLHVAETTDDGAIDESAIDFQEIDMSVHQMAFIGN